MKQIKYLLALFLILFIGCKTSITNTDLVETTNVINVNLDFDNDGVLDAFDKCPDLPGLIDNMGCPSSKTNNDSLSLDNNFLVGHSDTEKEGLVNTTKYKSKIKTKVNKKLNKRLKKETLQDLQYSTGLIAYKVPKEMTVGKSYLVKIRISKEKNKTMLVVGDRSIPIADDHNSLVYIEEINISPIMSANLIVVKQTFVVDSLSTLYQNISNNGYTEWAWNITPLKSGNNLLKINVKIRIKEHGESYYKDIVVFDKKVNIKSNIRFSIFSWISNHWQWIFAVILIPLIKWLYITYKQRK